MIVRAAAITAVLIATFGCGASGEADPPKLSEGGKAGITTDPSSARTT